MPEELANLATLLGFPAVVVAFVIDARVRSTAIDRETHLEMTRRYIEFVRLCMENPELKLSDTIVGYNEPQEVIEAGSKKLSVMHILVILFEDAFFLYHGSSTRLRRLEWSGWEKYIEYWLARSDFRTAWIDHLNAQYNMEFMEFMDRVYRRATAV